MVIKRWQKTGDPEILSSNRGRDLGNQKFINPQNGSVEEFTFFNGQRTSVLVFPLTADREIVAIRQFRHAGNEIFIELPGGNKNQREPNLKAAQRELLEETGYQSKNMVLFSTSKIWFEPSTFRNFCIPCLATGCVKVTDPKFDSSESMETLVVSIPEWLDMINTGLITDAKTLAITLLALKDIIQK